MLPGDVSDIQSINGRRWHFGQFALSVRDVAQGRIAVSSCRRYATTQFCADEARVVRVSEHFIMSLPNQVTQ